MPLPLNAEETKEYNNVPTTPKSNPLGDALNQLFSGGGSGVTVVADNAARLALTPTPGDIVFQDDWQTTYQWIDNGSGGEWRVAAGGLTPFPDAGTTAFGFDTVELFVDIPANGGDDNNDGRSRANPKATLGACFQDLNDAQAISASSGNRTFTLIRPGPGTYTEGDLQLTVNADFGVFIVPRFNEFVNNEPVTLVADNGFVPGLVSSRDLTVTPFTDFGRGERFFWRIGFGPESDAFPNFEGCPRPSVSPNLIYQTTGAPFWTDAILSEWECVIRVRRIDSKAELSFRGCHIDHDTPAIPQLVNTIFQGCKLTASGGASTVIVEGGDIEDGGIQNSYVEWPQVNYEVSSPGGTSPYWMFENDLNTSGDMLWFSGDCFYRSCYTERPPQMVSGGFTTTSAVSARLSALDVVLNDTLEIRAGSLVLLAGVLNFLGTTGTCIALSQKAQLLVLGGAGDILAPASVAGPGLVTFDSMAQGLGVSTMTGTSTPPGSEQRCGANPVGPFASENDFTAAGSEGVRTS